MSKKDCPRPHGPPCMFDGEHFMVSTTAKTHLHRIGDPALQVDGPARSSLVFAVGGVDGLLQVIDLVRDVLHDYVHLGGQEHRNMSLAFK